jgi:mRNA degradation ribonuclease J1/J2
MSDISRRSLSLTNDGRLSIVFLGVGSAFSKKFFQTNLFVVKGSDHLLIDCGTRAPEALSLLGLSVMNVQNYFITHSHADHIGGLEEVMLMNRYAAKKRTNIVIEKKYEKILWEMSLRGGASFNEEHGGKNLGFSDFWNSIRPSPLKGEDRELSEAKIGSISIKSFRTMHIPDSASGWKDSFYSCGLIIEDRILFTSDTRVDPDMVIGDDEKFEFDQIFHDCQFFKGGVHASLDELGALPEHIKKKTFLVHYADSVDGQKAKAEGLGFAGFVEQWKSYEYCLPRELPIR